MCGRDEARREVYKPKEEPEKGDRKKKKEGVDKEIEKEGREKEKKGLGIHRRKTLVRLTLYSKLV